MKLLVLVLISIFFHSHVYSQVPNKLPAKIAVEAAKDVTPKQKKTRHSRPPMDPNKIVQVKYGNSKWNKKPEKIDTGYVILLDESSGKMVHIQLDETEPDSAIFSGKYSLHWSNVKKVRPQIYILPQKKKITTADYRAIKQKINSGKIKRKPVVYRRGDKNLQILEVFNTKKQAKAAAMFLRKQADLNVKANTTTTNKANEGVKAMYNAQQLAKFDAAKLKVQKEGQERELDRLRREQEAKRKLDKLKKQQEAFSRAEQRRRRAKAKEYADAAVELFKLDQFSEAEKMFQKSFVMDPGNSYYQYYYGITLYRNKKYNEAIVALKLAEGKRVDKASRDYYIALCHYYLEEPQLAIVAFDKVRVVKHKTLSPSAAFYMGRLNMGLQDFDPAIANFQEVLDTSTDNRLDAQAEANIEKILQMKKIARRRASKLILSASLGTQYDSNVLNISSSDADAGTATEESAPRILTGVGLMYKPLNNETWSAGIKASTDYTYTITSKDSVDDYDTWLINARLPYQVSGLKLFGKNASLSGEATYEIMYFGQETSGSPKELLNGIYWKNTTTLIMTKSWILTLPLEYRQDTYTVNAGDTASTVEGQNSSKIEIGIGSINFIDDANKKGIISSAKYTLTSAKDDDNNSNKIDASLLYLTPTGFWKSNFIGGLSYYNLKYPKKDEPRTDNSIGVMTTISRPFTQWMDGALVANYSTISSTNTSSEYSKWTVGLFFNFETSL